MVEAERAVRSDDGTLDDSFLERERVAREANSRSLDDSETNFEPDLEGLSLREEDRARSKGLEETALLIMAGFA